MISVYDIKNEKFKIPLYYILLILDLFFFYINSGNVTQMGICMEWCKHAILGENVLANAQNASFVKTDLSANGC